MTQIKEVLKQRAADAIEAAFEVGYDEAAENGFEAGYADGYDDGLVDGRDRGYREALDVVESTRSEFGLSDDGDACKCEVCRPDAAYQTGARDETDNDLGAKFDDLSGALDFWAPKVDERLDSLYNGLDRALGLVEDLARVGIVLAQQVNELQTAVELAEADAVVLESLQDRVADLESFTGYSELVGTVGVV